MSGSPVADPATGTNDNSRTDRPDRATTASVDAVTSTDQPTDLIPGLPAIAYGGDYNPEQWPREVWDEDVALMREAGVNLVSVGIFSWALLEPQPGVFDFAWLDELLDLLHANGIGVALGTPTAAPPAWFWAAHPDARPVTREGLLLGHGSRGLASPSSPAYAAASAAITTALGERYGRHPAVKLWHVHNEYGVPVGECYSEHSVRAFRTWLEARYGTLESLNEQWGTTFWGQRYGAWHEIDAPRVSASVVNPAQRLDFARFSSDAQLACFVRERDILHRLSPGIPVTTNIMASSRPEIDYWRWAPEMDLIANDHYLTAERHDSHVMLSMDADLTRSLAGGAPWLLIEHSTSAVNWQPRNLAKRPGELARNSLAHLGRGADGVMFFQWRGGRFGAEKFHSSMLTASGTRGRIWREVVELGTLLPALDAVRRTRVSAGTALLWDWESFWAQNLEWRPSVELDARERMEEYYSRFWHAGITIDFAHPEADLSRYDTIVAPALYLMSEAATANLHRWVSAGGRLIVSYFSGIVDPVDRLPAGPMPGALREILGLWIDEFLPLREHETLTLSTGQTADGWAEAIVVEGAEVIATYVDGPGAGGPAITTHRLGAGTASYVSTRLRGAELDAVLTSLTGVPFAGERTVESVTRVGAGGRFGIHLNHGSTTGTVDAGGTDLVTGAPFDGQVPAGGVRVVALD
jgi:beta-galactosidase